LCELNYTPQLPDGSIDVTRAVFVNEQFQVSRQFWSHAVEKGVLNDPRSFINPVPHVSFVHGAERVDYLSRRREALVSNPLFATTTFIESPDEFARRLPLMAAERDPSVQVALNWTTDGTDVDFGSLPSNILNELGVETSPDGIAPGARSSRALGVRAKGGHSDTLGAQREPATRF
jgi:malate dehydrogenase (quinone)